MGIDVAWKFSWNQETPASGGVPLSNAKGLAPRAWVFRRWRQFYNNFLLVGIPPPIPVEDLFKKKHPALEIIATWGMDPGVDNFLQHLVWNEIGLGATY